NGSTQYLSNAGLRSVGSNAFLFECAVQGSAGHDWFLSQQQTSDGGPGVSVDGGTVLLQGCTVVGGEGGGSPSIGPVVCTALADGGVGLEVAQSGAPSRVIVVDTSIAGGAG